MHRHTDKTLTEGRWSRQARKKEGERESTQRRRLPASPAVGNPGSSIESGRRYVRTSERASEQRGRAREEVDASLPFGEESLPERYPGSCKAGAATRVSIPTRVSTVSRQSRPRLLRCRGSAVFGQPQLRPVVGAAIRVAEGERLCEFPPTKQRNAASRVGEATPRRSIKPRPDTPTVTTAQLLRRPRRRGARERGSVWW